MLIFKVTLERLEHLADLDLMLLLDLPELVDLLDHPVKLDKLDLLVSYHV